MLLIITIDRGPLGRYYFTIIYFVDERSKRRYYKIFNEAGGGGVLKKSHNYRTYMKKSLLLFSFFLFVIVTRVSFPQENKVCFKDNCFAVELAKTKDEQQRGLMLRPHLDEDKGMLFIYNNEEIRSFWMKNMRIPLDIIWISRERKVAGISRNIFPCNKEACLPLTPGVPVQYVLELNAGICDKIGLREKDTLIFHIQ